MDNKQKSILIFFFSLLLISLNLIKDNSAVADDNQGLGSKQLCSFLGDEHKYFPLDLDIYTFKGVKGENVVINLDADPSGSHRTERATLILTGRYRHFLKIDRSSLPNSITIVLPSSGEYFIFVVEQFTSKWSKGFKGKYCLTVKSTGEEWQSFRPLEPTSWSKYPITWVPETIEQIIELGQTAEATVSFVSRTSLRNANLWVVPELQPFISVEPKH